MLWKCSLAYGASILFLAFFLVGCDSRALRQDSNSSALEVDDISWPWRSGSTQAEEQMKSAIKSGKRLYRAWRRHPRHFDSDPYLDWRQETIQKQLPGDLTWSERGMLRSLDRSRNLHGYYGYDWRYPQNYRRYLNVSETPLPPPIIDASSIWLFSEIDVQRGTILVRHMYRGDSAPERFSMSDAIVKLWRMALSDVAWENYRHALREHDHQAPRGRLPNYVVPPLDGLEVIIFETMYDTTTVAILRQALISEVPGRLELPAPREIGEKSRKADQFWAIMGTPVGEIVQEMLTLCKESHGGKGVSYILVDINDCAEVQSEDTSYWLVFWLQKGS